MADWSDRTIPYGRNALGHMMSALYTDRGAACACWCPKCERPLIAHQGPTDRAWHFQHAPDANGAVAVCATAHETSVHEKAKTIILANASLMTPALMVGYRHYARVGIGAGWVTYTPSGLEVTLADVGRRPDAMIETVDGPVAIEIFVTSRAKLEKRADFSAHGLTAIEIDLSNYDRSIVDDEIALTEAVLNTARREWLFHPQKTALAEVFAAECIEAERVAAVIEAARLAAIAEAQRQLEAERAAARLEAEGLVAERMAEERRIAVAEAARLAALADADRERAAELAVMRAEAERLRLDASDRAAAEARIDSQQNLARLAADRAQQQILQEALALERADHQRQREILAAAEMLAKHDADGTSQRCLICTKPNSPFGFGLPPRPTIWACLLHRAQVDALFRPSPYAPLPRSRGNPRRDAKPAPGQGKLL